VRSRFDFTSVITTAILSTEDVWVVVQEWGRYWLERDNSVEGLAIQIRRTVLTGAQGDEFMTDRCSGVNWRYVAETVLETIKDWDRDNDAHQRQP
jgi:hypothetical protein